MVKKTCLFVFGLFYMLAIGCSDKLSRDAINQINVRAEYEVKAGVLTAYVEVENKHVHDVMLRTSGGGMHSPMFIHAMPSGKRIGILNHAAPEISRCSLSKSEKKEFICVFDMDASVDLAKLEDLEIRFSLGSNLRANQHPKMWKVPTKRK